MSDVVAHPNSPDAQLAVEEGRLETAGRSYFETGDALRNILGTGKYRDRLYRTAGFDTFEEYCRDRWQISQPRSSQLIGSADIGRFLMTNGYEIPVSERVARPLAVLYGPDKDGAVDEEGVVEAWADAIESRMGQRVRASDVEEAITRLKARRDKNWITLDEWREMPPDYHDRAFALDGKKTFNKQDNDSIEWAQWSWNPVTGCKHDCPYCYARDIAKRFYPQDFVPSIISERLTAPRHTKVPEKAESDVAFKNVFVCSMADLFGRWVPSEWIGAVLDQVADNPQWNFLFLTKFPKRYREFEFPANAWPGTTVDCQARVKAAESAFDGIRGGTKWLSIEPMLEPLTFNRLDLFDWLVIGGASRSEKTPEFHVPADWWAPLHAQAKQAGLQVYHKANLFVRERGFPGHVSDVPSFAPEPFQYLKSKSTEDVEQGESANGPTALVRD